MQSFPRRLLPLLVLVGLLCPPRAARCGELDPAYFVGGAIVAGARVFAAEDFRAMVAFEHGFMRFGDLVDFTGYRNRPGLDGPRYYRYGLRDEVMEGFRLGLRFHEQLDFVWSRTWATSAYRVWVDGVEAVNDPEGATQVQLPEVDMRIDMLRLAWRVESLARGGVAPTLGLGYGWILHSQKGAFQAPFRLPVDDSASDDTIELSVGLQGHWNMAQLGAEISGYSWRYRSTDQNVPASQVWSWRWNLQAGLVF